MNFSEALELMKQGKKVRRKDWESLDTYIAFSSNDLKLKLVDDSGEFQEIYYHLSKDDALAQDWVEYREQLLTEEEKDFLKMIIKFHPRKIDNVVVCLRKDYNLVYLQYEAENEYVGYKGDRPKDYDCYVTKKDYFNNLKDEKEYTLKELGLND